MISFFVPGLPAPQGSKRHVGNGRLIESSKKVKPWRHAVTTHSKRHLHTPLDGAVSLDVIFVMPRPKAWGKQRQDPMIQRPDIDKLLRSTLDGLTGIAIHDDSQVTHITAHKRRASRDEPTGAHITIAPANAGAFDIKEAA
ncbi:RusA family crossover junction endodeoxyribonuclease [Corynebacterium callunae]|uniref:RusA family crossover junction endodeoxyribonuclease n=1 Tax=Corynebacterium callunae TaxID=1721 RepID=UPI001FFF7C1C|nr:RusA family crossover junction endodeoxyribonuclease [Corynebacterium callunae]MCK2199180.1 RusA family crossover junction endodeoxyribonuclease [Corynebacterium callunae]